ncbi:hypothetical protein ACWGB8_08060 [Kitasatospora sp. NPDC054939]
MTDIRKDALLRSAAALLLAAGLGLTLAPAAQADGAPAGAPGGGAPAPVAAADLAQARAAAQSPAVLDRLGQFFAGAGAGAAAGPAGRAGKAPQAASNGAPQAAPQATPQATPRLVGETVPVYTLDAGFVAGRAGAPVARAEFTASKAVAADGRSASVWTVRQGDGWRVVNIASGGDETDYAARAAAGGGGTAFREPQLGAWYVLRDGRVLPLDEAGRRSVGEAGVSLAGYQELVARRYGDKLPGSAYDRAGKGGGYGPEAASGAAGGGGGSLPAATAAAALGATVLVGAGAAVRRRAGSRRSR